MKLLERQAEANREKQRAQEIAEARAEEEGREFESFKPLLLGLYDRAIQVLINRGERQRATIIRGSGSGVVGVHHEPATLWATPMVTVELGGGERFGLFIQTPPHVSWMDWCSAEYAVECGYAYAIGIGATGLERTLVLCKDPYLSKVVPEEINDKVFDKEGEKPTLQDVEEFVELVDIITRSPRATE